MKTFVVKTFDSAEGATKNLRIEADGYVVGNDGSLHFVQEKGLSHMHEPFLVFARDNWDMCALVPPETLDTRGTIEEVKNETNAVVVDTASN